MESWRTAWSISPRILHSACGSGICKRLDSRAIIDEAIPRALRRRRRFVLRSSCSGPLRMSENRDPVVFVWPGDLHLETADRENYKVAEWMVGQVNSLVRPDFVQFAGDNVQH